MTEKQLTLLLGHRAAGKTYAISGTRDGTPPARWANQHEECLMSLLPWREGEPVPPIGEGPGTRVVELGDRPTAYAWTLDGGKYGNTGARPPALDWLLSRYDSVVTDLAWPGDLADYLSRLRSEGVRVVGASLEVTRQQRYDQFVARRARLGKDVSPDTMARLLRKRTNFTALPGVCSEIVRVPRPHARHLLEMGLV